MPGDFCSPWTHLEGGSPFFKDLGKKIRDVFGSYGVGLFNMNVSGLITDYGMKFSDAISSSKENGDVFGTIESKFASSEQNIIFGQKWTSKNDLSAEFFLIDFCQGAQAKLIGTVNTKNDKKMLLVGSDYRNDKVALNLAAEFKSKTPVVTGSLAGTYESISLAYSTNFTSENSTFNTHDFRVSYDGPDFSVLGAVEDEFKVKSASVQAKLMDYGDGALELKHTSEGDDAGVLVTLGVKYSLDEDHVVRCKVNSKALIGLSLAQKINETTSLSLCTLIDASDITKGNHSIGFGLNISV